MAYLRILVLLALAACFATPAHATWSLLHNTAANTCGTTSATCALTITAISAGNVVTLYMASSITTDTLTAASTGGSYTFPAGCHSTDATAGSVNCGYTLSSTASSTTLTFMRSSATSATWGVGYAEYSHTLPNVAVGTASTLTRDQTTAVTNPAGVTLTLSAGNQIILQGIKSAATVSAISGTYTNPGLFATNFGYAGSINTSSGAAPTWTTTSGRAALDAISFVESSNTVPRMGLLQVGP